MATDLNSTMGYSVTITQLEFSSEYQEIYLQFTDDTYRFITYRTSLTLPYTFENVKCINVWDSDEDTDVYVNGKLYGHSNDKYILTCNVLLSVSDTTVGYTDTIRTDITELQPEVTPTLTKKFTRLYIGNTVASNGGKCFKKLTDKNFDELAGTWLFNETINNTGFPKSNGTYVPHFKFICDGIEYNGMFISAAFSSDVHMIYYPVSDGQTNVMSEDSVWKSDIYKTITITSTDEEYNANGDMTLDLFITWLNSNAVKQ